MRASPWARLIVVAAAAALAAGCVASPGAGGAGSSDKEKRSAPPSVAPTASDQTELPPGLVGRAWIANASTYGRWVAGRLGEPGVVRLAFPEHPIAAKGHWLVSAVWADDGSTTLRVRDLEAGSLAQEISRPEGIVAGVIVGNELVPGVTATGPSTDPGLLAISLVDGTTRQLLAPSPLPSDWTGDVSRTVIATPSGKSIVTGLCGFGHCAADIVDVTSGTFRRVFADTNDLYPGPSSDGVVMAGTSDGNRLSAFDATTGDLLWTRTGGEYQDDYLTTDGRLVLAYSDLSESGMWRISVLDPRSGAERVLLERDISDNLSLWPEFSTANEAAIGIGGRLDAAASQRPLTLVRMLDLQTGEFGHRTFPFRIDQ